MNGGYDLVIACVVCAFVGVVFGAIFYWAVQRSTLTLLGNQKPE